MFIATGAHSGYLPKAPGTWGSAVGVIVWLLAFAALLSHNAADPPGHAVVPVVNNLCMGCFANIPSSFVSKTNVDKVQKCESCGRLLYWP